MGTRGAAFALVPGQRKGLTLGQTVVRVRWVRVVLRRAVIWLAVTVSSRCASGNAEQRDDRDCTDRAGDRDPE